MTEYCLSNHALKPSSVGCHAGLNGLIVLSRLGTATTARATLRNNWLHLLQPCREPLDDGYLLPSVDLQLQLTPHEEVQRVDFLRVEVRTLRSQAVGLMKAG